MVDEVALQALVDHSGRAQHSGRPLRQRVCLSDGEGHRPGSEQVFIIII